MGFYDPPFINKIILGQKYYCFLSLVILIIFFADTPFLKNKCKLAYLVNEVVDTLNVQ